MKTLLRSKTKKPLKAYRVTHQHAKEQGDVVLPGST
jgi:hypothetical protein